MRAVKTPAFGLRQNLPNYIVKSLPRSVIKEGLVLAVTSKLFSLAEGRVIHTKNKKSLIKKSADLYLGGGPHGFSLTIKEGLLLPSAGIDESNAPEGGFILFPKNPYLSLKKLGLFLKSKWKLKQLGLLMTDSHTTPLRRGVSGIALAHFGFKAVRDLRGKKDLFGRTLKVTTINNIDALAAAAVWLMGEGSRQCPLALIENADLEWQSSSSKKEIRIPLKEDLYAPLFRRSFK